MIPSTNDPRADAETAAPATFACVHCGKRLRAPAASAGRKLKCPQCGQAVSVPEPEPAVEADVVIDEALPEPRQPLAARNVVAACGMMAVLAACAIYANLSYAVTDRAHYKYFPPFKPYINANMNDHLGAEYYNIARAMDAGEGFSSPFKEKTGPTAWMPPVLPTVLAAFLWLTGGAQDAVMVLVIMAQTLTLIATGLLVLALAWKTTSRVGAVLAAALFLTGVIGDFRLWFQQTHDCWIVLLVMDVVVAGFCFAAPLQSLGRAAGWGVCGGLVALTSPIAAFAWGVILLVVMLRHRAWRNGAITLVAAGLTLTPWVVRNYLVLGRLIPVKSNAAYELWQSQCLTPDGLLQTSVFGGHPYTSAGRERQLYKQLGELAFVDHKRELFRAAVEADPLDFVDRIACRGLGATLWYVPSDRGEMARRPWVLWASRVLHPLPFLAVLLLVATAPVRPMHPSQWVGIGAYLLYLAPYIAVSYYDRYAMPLLAVKALLVIWAVDRCVTLLRSE